MSRETRRPELAISSTGPLSEHNARLVSARKLTDARNRRSSNRFLAEGPQAVDGALRRGGTVVEIFVTADARRRHAELLARARDVPISEISDRAAARLSATATPPGLIAVCRRVDVDLDGAVPVGAGLVAVLVATNDPGNAGTIVRTSDAAGADGVVLTRPGVDLYNGKAVRASAGSIFHLPVAIEADITEVLDRAGALGLQVLAATGAGSQDLYEFEAAGRLARPTVWLFGNEAHGLPADVLARATERVRVPIYGAAESLNLAAAAAVCLYASTRARRALLPAGHPPR